ncbi:MAG TPA: hypothetical protein VFP84_34610 [Kofleriaceae bacterium]|nr:hypothetical protein [Kofleriaceae bacterium]
MIAIDFDTQTYNTVASLQADVAAASAAYDTAKASSDALNQRLSVFSVELDVAKQRLSIAESDQAATDAAEKSVAAALLEALRATRQAVIIYASARSTLALAEAAAQQTLTAAYDTSELLSHVVTASAKNSYITRKLLIAAEQADANAAAAVSAAVIALTDTTQAFIACERAAGAAFLVVASLVNLQMLISGYQRAALSNEDELPSALSEVPALDLSIAPELPAKLDAAAIRAFDQFVLRQSPELGTQPLNDLPVSADLLSATVDEYMASTEKLRIAHVSAVGALTKRGPTITPPAHVRPDLGLQPGFKLVCDIAQAYETEIQDANTLTRKAATAASQDLSRKSARLQTAQAALAAAQQAAGT